MIGTRGRERLLARDAMAGGAIRAEESRLAMERELGQNRVTETSLHQTLDGLRIVGFHGDARSDSDLVKKTVDDGAHVAAAGIEEKLRRGELGWRDGADMPAANR